MTGIYCLHEIHDIEKAGNFKSIMKPHCTILYEFLNLIFTDSLRI